MRHLLYSASVCALLAFTGTAPGIAQTVTPPGRPQTTPAQVPLTNVPNTTVAPNTAQNVAPPANTNVPSPAYNQMVDVQNAQTARLKAELRLTPDQDKNWGRFEAAMHDVSSRRADRLRQLDQAAQASAAQAGTSQGATSQAGSAQGSVPTGNPAAGRPPEARPSDFAVDLRMDADVMTTRAEDYRKFADAASPLFESLDDQQRHRFLAFVDYFLVDEARDEGRMAPMEMHHTGPDAYHHPPMDAFHQEQPGLHHYGDREYGPDHGADHGSMDHGYTERGHMDRGYMDHGHMDRGYMDHGQMDHGYYGPEPHHP